VSRTSRESQVRTRRRRGGMRLAPTRTAKGRQLVEGPVPIGGDAVGPLGCPPPSEILCLM